MEEIDIIELLKRVKEGKAPKEIEIKNKIFTYNQSKDISYLYSYYADGWLQYDIDFDTKIKILDKPIIEELDTIIGDIENPSHNEILILNWIRNNRIKINEIIRYLRSRDEG